MSSDQSILQVKKNYRADKLVNLEMEVKSKAGTYKAVEERKEYNYLNHMNYY